MTFLWAVWPFVFFCVYIFPIPEMGSGEKGVHITQLIVWGLAVWNSRDSLKGTPIESLNTRPQIKNLRFLLN